MTILAKISKSINMLQNKVREKIQELQIDFTPSRVNEQNILSGFKALKLTGRFQEFNIFKKRGYCISVIMSYLIKIVLSSSKTVHGYMRDPVWENKHPFGKDVLYRLKNDEHVNWRLILWRIAELFLKTTSQSTGTASGNPRYAILDDTVLPKAGRKLEFIGRVWDHVTQRSVLGFKLLTMVYWDGRSSIPLDFSIHREKGKNEDRPYGITKRDLKKCFSRKRVKESDSNKRVKELDISKIEMSLRMFYRAVYRCIGIDYVLVDSWFTCSALIRAVRGVKGQTIHLIGMYKIATTKFLFAGEKLTYGQINNKLGKAKRCRSLRYHYKRAEVMLDDMPAVLFFSRHGKRDKWKVILTTDTRLNFIKVIEHYSVRWTIEVFYKESKQLLNLGKCQSNHFDAQVADTTISMITYILLTLRNRYDNYESMGALFRTMNAEVLRETLDKRICGLMVEMLQVVAIVFEIDIDVLIEKLFTSDAAQDLMFRMLDGRAAETG